MWTSHKIPPASRFSNYVAFNNVMLSEVPAGVFSDYGTYSWRVQAVDPSGYPVSGWSSWCEFTVDTVKPGTPFVSSSAYPADGQWHGIANLPAQFTFKPVVTTDGLVAHYPLNEGRVAADSSTAGRSLMLQGAAMLNTSTLWTDGITGEANTAPVVDSSKDFSVSAWAYPTSAAPGAWRTIAAQTGDWGSAFFLRTNGSQWFATTVSADNGGGVVTDLGAGSVAVGQWTHVGATYEAATKKLSLYINGVLAASTTSAGTFDATRRFVVGRDTWSASTTHHTPWAGEIDDVRVYARALTAAEMPALADPAKPPVSYPNLAGYWTFSDPIRTAPDASGGNRPLTLNSGALNSAQSGGSALWLNGTTGQADAASAIDTSKDFTVGAWAYVRSGGSGWRSVLSQKGDWASTFFLRTDGTQWNVTTMSADSSGGTLSGVNAPGVTTDAWTHVAFSYQAATKQMTLYVNGRAAVTGTSAGMFNATKGFTAGRDKWDGSDTFHNPLNGDVDDIRVYNRTLTNSEVWQLADQVSYSYQLDTETAPREFVATGESIAVVSPPAGYRVLTVRAKSRNGIYSDPATHRFQVGEAGLAQPREGANIVEKMKLQLAAKSTYTRVTFQYRRGPGGAEFDVPAANMRTAVGATPLSNPISLSTLGSYGVWQAVDTLGSTGGVVQVRAKLQTASDTDPAIYTGWVTVNVDPNGDGAATATVGPGSVNLLTGDHTLSATDIDEFGLSVARTASSREPADGWSLQGQRLTSNQQQVSTDTAGFDPANVTVTRVTDRGQGSTSDSLRLVPAAAGSTSDTYSAVGGDNGGLRLNMKPGKRYRMSGWIYVPPATGLTPDNTARGLRIVGLVKTPAGYVETASAKAAWTGGWQELSVDLTVPADATEAFFRLYNGFLTGTGKEVFWDNHSVRELVAPFGPQWRGGVADAVAGVDYTSLEFPSADVAAVNLASGGKVTFGKSISGAFFPQPGAESLTLSKADDNAYRMTDIDGTVAEFVKQADKFVVGSVWDDGAKSNTTTRFVYDTTDSRTLVKKVISPTEPGIGDCTTAVPARGCEVLEYEYATVTTAAGSTLGDVVDQVRAVKLWSWDPAAGAVTSAEVARYAYELVGGAGRLREVWDARITPALKTAYAYDSAGRVISVTTAGQLPWSFDYGTIGADTNAGWLHRTRRASLVQGSKTQTGPENATRIVYKVPMTRGAGGPYNLDTATVATWAQTEAPTDGTAIFGPQDDPGTVQASASLPGPDGYKYATVHYLNAFGQEVNTATPAANGVTTGNIDTIQYDRFGNGVFTLEATNRLLALGALPNAASMLTELELSALDTAGRAARLATASTYSGDGTDLLVKTGPQTKAVLEAAHGGYLAKSTVAGRKTTVNTYDEGRPDGATYRLVTTEQTGLAVAGISGLADVRVTKNGYDPINGSASGWTLKKPTVVTTDAGTGGANLSTYTVYDTAGRTIKSWGVGTSASQGAKQIIYYTVGTNPDDAACGNQPQWAARACLTRMVGESLPVRRVESYNRYGDAAVVSESNAGKTRTTTTTFDTAGRVATVSVSANDGTAAVPTATTTYDPASGQPISTTAGSMSTWREYDLLGRVVKYTDADGGITTSEYDRYDRPARTLDPTGTVTYGYDRDVEPRGMLTTLTDNNVGTFTAGYSADGQLTQVRYPGGITRTDTLDANLQPQARSYTRDSDSIVLYTETVQENPHGQWAVHVYTGGSKAFTYDRLGRLTKAAHTTGGQCTLRTYEFTGAEGSRTNRTAKKTWLPDATGACDPTGAADATASYAYDTADRLLSDSTGSYTYDVFGRTTAAPGGLSVGYFANDVVASQTLGTSRQTWTLDPAMRLRAFTTETFSGGVWGNPLSKVNHYDGDSDSPKWITENTATGNWTRMVESPDGDFAITASQAGVKTLNAVNLHGDVVFTLDLANPGGAPLAYCDYDEYGTPTARPGRYGWLGAKQRSTEALAGITLMGVRLYSAPLGRFLSVDPVDGGSCNRYEYTCADPINKFDIDGKRCYRVRNRYFDNLRCKVGGLWRNGVKPAFRRLGRDVTKCGFGSPCDRRIVNAGAKRFIRNYCGLSARTRWFIAVYAFVVSLSPVGMWTMGITILALEGHCAFRS